MSRWRRQQKKRARRAKFKIKRERAELHRYVPVLARMHSLLKRNPRLTYGDALGFASRELRMEIPRAVEIALLRSAFKLTTSSPR